MIQRLRSFEQSRLARYKTKPVGRVEVTICQIMLR